MLATSAALAALSALRSTRHSSRPCRPATVVDPAGASCAANRTRFERAAKLAGLLPSLGMFERRVNTPPCSLYTSRSPDAAEGCALNTSVLPTATRLVG